jgi:hypothetical protein
MTHARSVYDQSQMPGPTLLRKRSKWRLRRPVGQFAPTAPLSRLADRLAASASATGLNPRQGLALAECHAVACAIEPDVALSVMVYCLGGVPEEPPWANLMLALSGNQATRNPKHVRGPRMFSYGHDDRKFDLGTSSLSLYNRTRHWDG